MRFKGPKYKHHRHPCDTYWRYHALACLIRDTVREALFPKHSHPDSKRTRKAKLRAKADQDARRMKRFMLRNGDLQWQKNIRPLSKPLDSIEKSEIGRLRRQEISR